MLIISSIPSFLTPVLPLHIFAPELRIPRFVDGRKYKALPDEVFELSLHHLAEADDGNLIFGEDGNQKSINIAGILHETLELVSPDYADLFAFDGSVFLTEDTDIDHPSTGIIAA